MKTFILSLLLLFSFSVGTVFVGAGNASAVNIFTNCGQGSDAGNPVACQDAQQGHDSPTDPAITALRIAIQLMAVVVGLGAVIGIIVSAIRISIAHGDAQAVATARTALIYSLIGLAIAGLAQVIVLIIVGFVN